ncbi:hypothetical protein D3C71_332110 [compost metagenome]
MLKYTRFFSAATLASARPTPELVPPKTMLRPCVSIHSRAFEAAMSGLFWWSTVSSSTGLPAALPPKSSMAIWIASAPFLPSRSAYRLDMSVMKPILTLSWPCAWADAASASALKARAKAVS